MALHCRHLIPNGGLSSRDKSVRTDSSARYEHHSHQLSHPFYMAYDPTDYTQMSHIPNSQSRPANGMALQTHRNGYHSQKENGMPVPGAETYYRNGQENNPMMSGPPMFDLARSPPGGPNKSGSNLTYSNKADEFRHKACTMQVLQTRHLPSWECMPLLSFNGPHDSPSSLQILHEGL